MSFLEINITWKKYYDETKYNLITSKVNTFLSLTLCLNFLIKKTGLSKSKRAQLHTTLSVKPFLHSSSLYTKLNILENNREPLKLVNRLINALY